MKPILVLALAVPLIATGLTGQSCVNPCVSSHWGDNLVSTQFLPTTFAIRVPGLPQDDVICQVEFFCKTRSSQPVSMPVWIYDRGPSGAPQSQIGAGTMFVGTSVGAYTASVQAPVQANTDFFVVFDNAIGDLTPPVAGFGGFGNDPAQEHWHTGPNWAGPHFSGRYIYRLYCSSGTTEASFSTVGQGCPGGNGVPLIGTFGSPLIGETVQVTLTQAPAQTMAVFFMGFTPNLIDLGVLGAPGCVLEQDVVFAHSTTTGSTGAVAYPLALPNNATLVGIPIRAQWTAVDPGANALGLIFTPGGILTIGDF